MTEKNKIQPINRAEFGLAEHRYNRFDATVPAKLTNKDLQSPDLWVNLAAKVRPGNEIRACADDDSWVALLYVTYSSGNQLRAKVVYRVDLEKVDRGVETAQGDYDIKLRGPKKWCIIQISTGDIKKDMIPTQLEAMKEMTDLVKALAA